MLSDNCYAVIMAGGGGNAPLAVEQPRQAETFFEVVCGPVFD